MNENLPARRAEDKRADGAVDWTDAPRFTALGIAETWTVTVEAEGQRVVRISEESVAGLDGEHLGQFVPTIRSCAQHLLGLIGAAPVSHTAGAAKGGISSPEGLQRYAPSRKNLGAMVRDATGRYFDSKDVERLLATTAGEQAEPEQHEREVTREDWPVLELAAKFSTARQVGREFSESSLMAFVDELKAQAAPAAPPQVQAIPTAALTDKGRAVKWDPIYATEPWVSAGYRPLFLAAPSAVAPAAPTELSQRLRAKATQPFGPEDFALLTAAAEEIERYYGGMMAWKRTAEKKDRDWNAERMARENERCAARAVAPAAPEQDEVRNQALEDAAKVCDEICMDYWDQYKGRGKYAPNNPNRANSHTEGVGDGADMCSDAIRAMKTATNEGEQKGGA